MLNVSVFKKRKEKKGLYSALKKSEIGVFFCTKVSEKGGSFSIWRTLMGYHFFASVGGGGGGELVLQRQVSLVT